MHQADASVHAAAPLPALDGISPDGVRYTLYRDAAGVELSCGRLARIAELIDPGGPPGPGGCCQLRVEVANDFAVVDGDGKRIAARFREVGLGRRFPLTGTLVIADGWATSFGIGVDSTSARAAAMSSNECGVDNDRGWDD